VKQKPGRGGGGVEACDFTVFESHGHPLVPLIQMEHWMVI
jgi:hypothetical protein